MAAVKRHRLFWHGRNVSDLLLTGGGTSIAKPRKEGWEPSSRTRQSRGTRTAADVLLL